MFSSQHASSEREFLGIPLWGAIRVKKNKLFRILKTAPVTSLLCSCFYTDFWGDKNSEINADRLWTTYLQLREKVHCSCSITNYSLAFFFCGKLSSADHHLPVLVTTPTSSDSYLKTVRIKPASCWTAHHATFLLLSFSTVHANKSIDQYDCLKLKTKSASHIHFAFSQELMSLYNKH